MAVPYTFGSATTSIPLSQLDSNFATAITLGNTAVQLGNTITTLTGVTNVASSGSLTLGTSGNTTAVTIDTSQNVGVGNTPSSWNTYKVTQIGGGTADVSIASNNDDTNISTNAYYNTGWKYQSSSTLAERYQQGAGTHRWYYAPSGTAGNAITWSEAMRIDSSGRVGIGTTTTSNATLTVNNADLTSPLYIGSQSDSSSWGGFFVNGATSSTAGNGIYGKSGASFYYNVASGLNHIWTTNGGEKMRIDSSGNLLVGTTSTGSTANGFQINNGSYGNSVIVSHNNTSASGIGYIGFYYSSGQIGSITQNGTTGVLYNLTSDYRLKNNPVALTGAKDFVMALQPKTWDWWDGSGKGVGFIAHEFMEVAKYSGHGEKDAVDEDGKPVYQSIQPSSSEVMANMVALMQEQQATITAQAETLTQQTETINALTARVVALEAK